MGISIYFFFPKRQQALVFLNAYCYYFHQLGQGELRDGHKLVYFWRAGGMSKFSGRVKRYEWLKGCPFTLSLFIGVRVLAAKSDQAVRGGGGFQ